MANYTNHCLDAEACSILFNSVYFGLPGFYHRNCIEAIIIHRSMLLDLYCHSDGDCTYIFSLLALFQPFLNRLDLLALHHPMRYWHTPYFFEPILTLYHYLTWHGVAFNHLGYKDLHFFYSYGLEVFFSSLHDAMAQCLRLRDFLSVTTINRIDHIAADTYQIVNFLLKHYDSTFFMHLIYFWL